MWGCVDASIRYGSGRVICGLNSSGRRLLDSHTISQTFLMRHLIQKASSSQSDDFAHSRQKRVVKLESVSKYTGQILLFKDLGLINAVFIVLVVSGFDGPAPNA